MRRQSRKTRGSRTNRRPRETRTDRRRIGDPRAWVKELEQKRGPSARGRRSRRSRAADRRRKTARAFALRERLRPGAPRGVRGGASGTHGGLDRERSCRFCGALPRGGRVRSGGRMARAAGVQRGVRDEGIKESSKRNASVTTSPRSSPCVSLLPLFRDLPYAFFRTLLILTPQW